MMILLSQELYPPRDESSDVVVAFYYYSVRVVVQRLAPLFAATSRSDRRFCLRLRQDGRTDYMTRALKPDIEREPHVSDLFFCFDADTIF
jgi:hypothetical protein